MSAVDDAFEALFFGEGAILGLLLFMVISSALMLKQKYLGALNFPLILLLEAEYYSRLNVYGNFVWHMFVLICYAIFTAIYMVFGKEGR